MFLLKYVQIIINRHFRPRSTDPDIHRKELILNSLLFCFLVLLLGLLTLVICSALTSASNIGVIKFILLSFPFIASYYFSRKRFITLASIILISVFTVGAWIAIINWDILLPAALLSLVLCTTIVGNLFSSKAAFIYVIISGLLLLIFSHLTTFNILSTDGSWKNNQVNIFDTIEIILFLLFTSGISWISNRQTELSLIRARASERDLKLERDTLEIKVIERTKEIEHIQIEKISELYTFIEFGKISAGLIHDLMSPLTALCIEIESNEINPIHNTSKSENLVNNQEIKQSIKRLLGSSQKIQHIIKAAKNQIKVNLQSSTFNLKEILEETLMVNQHRIRKSNIEIKTNIPSFIVMTGYHSLFTHICTNIISNAIDACNEKLIKSVSGKYHPHIQITCQLNKDQITLRIKDNGAGIPETLHHQIFNPFFSTKGEKGCGLGLAASKHIAEKYFNATLELKSINSGNHRTINDYQTEFVLNFPTNT